MRAFIQSCDATIRAIPVGLAIADTDRADNVLWYKYVIVLLSESWFFLLISIFFLVAMLFFCVAVHQLSKRPSWWIRERRFYWIERLFALWRDSHGLHQFAWFRSITVWLSDLRDHSPSYGTTSRCACPFTCTSLSLCQQKLNKMLCSTVNSYLSLDVFLPAFPQLANTRHSATFCRSTPCSRNHTEKSSSVVLSLSTAQSW